jgi:hypothetical protein
MAEMEGRPEPRVVSDFHTNDDVNQDRDAHHHTLGMGPNEAAAGSHNHRGSDSVLLLQDIEITGSRGGNTALASVIAALVELGAKDSSTA